LRDVGNHQKIKKQVRRRRRLATIRRVLDDLWELIRSRLPPEKPAGTVGRPIVPYRTVLDGTVVKRPRPTRQNPQHLCEDKGYDYPECREQALARGYIPHIPHKGTDPSQVPAGEKRHPARRWVVERTHSWQNCLQAAHALGKEDGKLGSSLAFRQLPHGLPNDNFRIGS
jgi:hypothetical protein